MFMTLDELKNYTPRGNLYALAGCPVGHSISPQIHNYMFSQAKVESEYISVEVKPEELPEFVKIARLKLAGFNCTIPHKQTIIKYLSKTDTTASDCGAVNTVKIEDGRLYGYNTDGYGFMAALSFSQVRASDKRALVLGNGGAARAIALCLARNGCDVTAAGRDIKKTKAMAGAICGASGTKVKYAEISKISGKFDLLANATPVGMYPNEGEAPMDINKIEGLSFVFDAVYNPPRTELLKAAQSQGIKTLNGTSMLAFQAVSAFEIWTGQKVSNNFKEKVENYAQKILCKDRLEKKWGKSSIVLTGFMASGKSTVGKMLAKKLNMRFIDLDELIEAREKMKVLEIFQSRGEKYFRQAEYRAVCEVYADKNCVISTGGGTVTFDRNLKELKRHSVIVFLDAPIEKIRENLKESKPVRPMIVKGGKTADDLVEELYYKRLPVYREAADIEVTAAGAPVETCGEIIAAI